jgi:para-aminobenzoate synthetase
MKGALGYFSLDGATDLSVVIRTIIVEGSRESLPLSGIFKADYKI